MQDRRGLRRRLLGLVAVQSGHFTAAQAKDIGYSYQSQKYHVDAGNWLRIDRGIMRIPEWPVGTHDHFVRWSLWSRDRAVVSHQSALSIHDLGDVNPEAIHLTASNLFAQRPPESVVLHRGDLTDVDIADFEGFRATTPLRSLFDVAADGVAQDVVDRAVADALDRGVVTRRQLLHRADEFSPTAALLIERALAKGARS